MRRRIEGAMAAGVTPAAGHRPPRHAALLAAPTDVNRGGKVGGGRVSAVIDWYRPTCAEPTDRCASHHVLHRRDPPDGPTSSSATSSKSPHESFTGPRSIHTSIHVTTTDTAGGQLTS